MAKLQTSPGNAHPPSRLCPPHLRTSFPYRYRTLKIIASSSSLHASYAISVRRTSALPAASFRFHLAMDTLAVQLTIPPVGFVGDFHSQVSAPCRAHNKKGSPSENSESLLIWSGRRDSNSGPHPPQGCALPGCATSRQSCFSMNGKHPMSKPSAGVIIFAWLDVMRSQPRLHPADQVSLEAVSRSESWLGAGCPWDFPLTPAPELGLAPN
jgi:hypothetical protein